MGLHAFASPNGGRARSIVLAVGAALMAIGAGVAPAQAATSDISATVAYVSTPGKSISLQGMVVTNDGPDTAAGVTVSGVLPAADNEGNPVDWEIFTNDATVAGAGFGFAQLMALSGPPYGTDPCAFTSATAYRCDIGPLAVGQQRTVVFTPLWETPNAATGITQWTGASFSADVVGGTDPDPTNNDDVTAFADGFYYMQSAFGATQPDELQVVEQAPPASGSYAPGATVTLEVTSTVQSATPPLLALVVPDPDEVTCTGDGVCLTGGPRALTGPANRVTIVTTGAPITPGGWWSDPTPPPYVFTTTVSAKLPDAAPGGCTPGGTVPLTFHTTQQPMMGGSGPVWTSILEQPITVQIACPAAHQPPSGPTPPGPIAPGPSQPADGPTTPPATPAQPSTPRTVSHRRSKRPVLLLTKTAHPRRVRAGRMVVYRLKVRNPSSVRIRHVRVCDRLPLGLAFRGSNRRAQLRKGRECWTIRALPAHGSRTIVIRAKALIGARGRKVNHATATAKGARRAKARTAVRIIAAPRRVATPVTG